MKKILLPLLIMFFLTGCGKIENENYDYKEIVNKVLANNNHNVNTASIGYKYYIPIGVNLIYDNDFNKGFKIKDTKFVLYVDIVSYYYKNSLNYVKDREDYYYSSNVNNGYILINEASEYDDYFYLEIVYNYAKIESYVKKEYLVDTIVYSTIILNSITYNDSLIMNFIEQGVSFGNEITYEIDKPDDSESKFSQYLQEYVQNEEEKSSDIAKKEVQ